MHTDDVRNGTDQELPLGQTIHASGNRSMTMIHHHTKPKRSGKNANSNNNDNHIDDSSDRMAGDSAPIWDLCT